MGLLNREGATKLLFLALFIVAVRVYGLEPVKSITVIIVHLEMFASLSQKKGASSPVRNLFMVFPVVKAREQAVETGGFCLPVNQILDRGCSSMMAQILPTCSARKMLGIRLLLSRAL